MEGAALMQCDEWLLSPGLQHGSSPGGCEVGVTLTKFLCLRQSIAVRAPNLLRFLPSNEKTSQPTDTAVFW